MRGRRKKGEPPHVSEAVGGRGINALDASLSFPSVSLHVSPSHSLSVTRRERKQRSSPHLGLDVGLEAEQEALVAADEHRRGHGFGLAFFSPVELCFDY